METTNNTELQRIRREHDDWIARAQEQIEAAAIADSQPKLSKQQLDEAYDLWTKRGYRGLGPRYGLSYDEMVDIIQAEYIARRAVNHDTNQQQQAS